MPRPKHKEELIVANKENYEKLLKLINSYSPEEQEKEFPEGTLNRNIRDVLGHLHHWHLLFMGWYTTGLKGEKPDIPAKGYNWRETPALNALIQKEYAATPLKKIKSAFQTSHLEVSNIITTHSQEELFSKKYFKWTGNNSLAAYLIGATSSHYEWARKPIKKCKTG